MAGVATVFSITSCRFCEKAKRILKEHNIPYTEINLDDYPKRRGDMIAMADAMTVPQVFFNNKHMGGADAIEALESSGELDKIWAQADTETLDSRLAAPEGPPAPRPTPSPRNLENFEAGSVKLNLVEVVYALRKELGVEFKGAQLSKQLKVIFGLEGENDSDSIVANLAGKLISAGALTWRKSKTPVQFQADQTTFVLPEALEELSLNNFREWKDRVDEPLVVVTALKKKLNAVLGKHRTADAKTNYLAASEDPEFAVFEESASELQKFSLSEMDEKTRLAFVINLYNLLTLHAFTKVGVPAAGMDRTEFFDFVGYTLGGLFYSFNALENGILRSNKNPPYHLQKTIRSNDPRAGAVLSTCNPALHACISCGASSCPPIKTFTAEAIDEEMRIAAQAFFELDENCKINVEANTITVTKIVAWYQKDFGTDMVSALRTVQGWLRGQKAKDAETVLNSPKPIINFAEYDWSTDAHDSKQYTKHRGTLQVLAHMVFGTGR